MVIYGKKTWKKKSWSSNDTENHTEKMRIMLKIERLNDMGNIESVSVSFSKIIGTYCSYI